MHKLRIQKFFLYLAFPYLTTVLTVFCYSYIQYTDKTYRIFCKHVGKVSFIYVRQSICYSHFIFLISYLYSSSYKRIVMPFNILPANISARRLSFRLCVCQYFCFSFQKLLYFDGFLYQWFLTTIGYKISLLCSSDLLISCPGWLQFGILIVCDKPFL